MEIPFQETMANVFPTLLLALGTKKIIAGVVVVVGIVAAVYFLVIKKKSA